MPIRIADEGSIAFSRDGTEYSFDVGELFAPPEFENSNGEPLFSISEEGWGTGWTAGGTVSLDLETSAIDCFSEASVVPREVVDNFRPNSNDLDLDSFREALERIARTAAAAGLSVREAADALRAFETTARFPKLAITHFRGTRKLKIG